MNSTKYGIEVARWQFDLKPRWSLGVFNQENLANNLWRCKYKNYNYDFSYKNNNFALLKLPQAQLLQLYHLYCNNCACGSYIIFIPALYHLTIISYNISFNYIIFIPASWSSGNAFVSRAGGLSFKSRAGQIGHSVANGSPPMQRFFEWSCVTRAQWRGDGPRQLVTPFGVIQRV